MYKIRLNLEPNPGPDRVYTVTSPDMPGLVTEGSTPEEIARHVQEVVELLLESCIDDSMPLPPAFNQPFQFEQVDFLIALPEALEDALEVKQARQEVDEEIAWEQAVSDFQAAHPEIDFS